MIKIKKKNKPIIIAAIISLFLIVSAVSTVVLLHNNEKTPIFFSTTDEKVFGIDVSQHNGTIEWNKVKKSNAKFAFVRVGVRGYSKGTISADTEYNNNLQGANDENLPVGVYFFSQATSTNEAKEEAKFVLDSIKGYDINLPIVIDVEYTYDKDGQLSGRLFDAKLSAKEQSEIINAFAKKVTKAGFTPMVYSNSYMMRDNIDVSNLDSNILIWIADYNENVTYSGEFNMWQYSKTGKVDGVNSKYVDTNYWFTNNK